MLGLGKRSMVAEHQATGEIERVYHEIRQTLRVSGVNLIFRTWAAHDGLLPVLWDALQPVAATRAFEDGADQLRSQAAQASESMSRLNAAARAGLGESQAHQVRAALELYHYINPKLLLLTSLARRILSDQESGQGGAINAPSGAETEEQILTGVPPSMYPMEMVDEKRADAQTKQLFDDIKQTLSLDSINSDYRTLALWPDYLSTMWSELKLIVRRPEYEQAVLALLERSRALAVGFPLTPVLRRNLEAAGANYDQALESAESFERLLPGLILHIALCLLDWHRGNDLAHSPFPAESRRASQPQVN